MKFPEYKKKYEIQDDINYKIYIEGINKKKLAMRAEFNEFIAERRAEFEAHRAEYLKIIGRDPKEVAKDTEEYEETIEELLDEEEEVLD